MSHTDHFKVQSPSPNDSNEKSYSDDFSASFEGTLHGNWANINVLICRSNLNPIISQFKFASGCRHMGYFKDLTLSLHLYIDTQDCLLQSLIVSLKRYILNDNSLWLWLLMNAKWLQWIENLPKWVQKFTAFEDTVGATRFVFILLLVSPFSLNEPFEPMMALGVIFQFVHHLHIPIGFFFKKNWATVNPLMPRWALLSPSKLLYEPIWAQVSPFKPQSVLFSPWGSFFNLYTNFEEYCTFLGVR